MEVFVARQPIFNIQQEVCAYELLYRVGTNNIYDNSDGDYATSQVIANSFLLIGIEELTEGKRAYINFTENLLINEVAYLLPKDSIAVEILENVEVTKEIITACRKLKQSGYLLVLDDFVINEKFEPLIELADIIKVDFLNTNQSERKHIVEKYKSRNIQFLAEKVETKEEFEEALTLGYSYFQGYFFSKPIILSGRNLESYKLNYLQLIKELNSVDVDYNKIESIIKRDVALSFKLLKYINSAAFGFRIKVDSIKHALVMLGINQVKKWLSLIALRNMGENKPDEVMVSCIIRAKFGELLAPKFGLRNRCDDIFLMGMFSMIDALLDRPLISIFNELPISDDIKNAILGNGGPFLSVYELILSYEKGDWVNFSKYASEFNLVESQVPDLYIESINWARQLTLV